MPLASRSVLTAVLVTLALALPAVAGAHTFDPFDPEHEHRAQTEGGTGNGAVVAVAVVVLLAGTAGALIGLRRTGRIASRSQKHPEQR